MQMKSIQLKHKNWLNKEYRSQHSNITPFFHYHPFEDFEQRVEDVKKQEYKRHELSNLLEKMNQNWGASEETLEQISRLKEPDSVVVIGGQQAGLLTGPTYSVNKVISILRLAKEQEEKLNVSVIPVFWIAGEDHDFDEVNHVFSLKKNQLYKHTMKQEQVVRESLSDMPIDHKKAEAWLKMFLNDLHETNYTKDWFEETLSSLKASETLTDFFARLIFRIFPNQGLVLMDAHAPEVRQLESNYFTQLIHQQHEIHTAAYETLQQLQQKGYEIPLEMETEDANLFYRDQHGERILLKYEDHHWVGKHEEVMLSTDEILQIAEESPEKLSNNVITRPLMQELLFPTLAFIAGDGEINYWATLKKSFEVLDTYMPPVVPRLSFTYVTGRIQKLLDYRVLDVEDVIQDGLEHVKVHWLASQSTAPVDTLFEQAKQSMENVHIPLQEYAATVGADLEQLAEKNMQYIQKQMDFLKQKTYQKLEGKYHHELDQFDEISIALNPQQGLQERIFNPYHFVNEYGYDCFRRMIDAPDISFQNEHYIVYL